MQNLVEKINAQIELFQENAKLQVEKGTIHSISTAATKVRLLSFRCLAGT